MKLDVVGCEGIAAAIGLAADAAGAPRRDCLASAIRRYLGTRPAVRETELVSWMAALCASVGFPTTLSHPRIRSVLDMLLSAGDAAALPSDNGLVIMATFERQVSVTPRFNVLLGGREGERSPADQPPGAVIRHLPAGPADLTLTGHLGEPGFRQLLPGLGISPEIDLRDMPSLLADMARISGEAPGPDVTPDPLFDLGHSGARVAAIGNGEIVVLVRNDRGTPAALHLRDGEAAGWLWLASQGRTALREWPERVRLPAQILRALVLCGEADDDSLRTWNLDPDAEAELLRWLALDDTLVTATSEDPSQDRVVFAAEDERLLVEAGPGSGKTWTLCRRVGHLIEKGLSPPRILVISFTRAAVSEIRERIGTYLDNPFDADAIRIVTLDSLASRIRHGFGDDDPGGAGGFDANIAETLALIRSGDDDLLDYIEGIEHLFVDEAQDLTGQRRDLVLAILQRLAAVGGATVFHDPAQAIYGFVAGEHSGVEVQLANEGSGFTGVSLERNYRVEAARLGQLFRDARVTLARSEAEPASRYEAVRSSIEAAADAVVGPARQQQVGPADGRTFLLYRSRGEVTAAAADLLSAGLPFKVRLSRNRAIVQPWIGALLRDCAGGPLDRATFDTRWEDASPLPARSADYLWSVLFRFAGLGDGRLDLDRLALRLTGAVPPPELTQPDIGRPGGPLLSTIHAAKGREADTVHLMLPRYPEDTSGIDWDEEARVLFVGATRARRTLRVGSASTWLRSMKQSSRRLWQQRNRGERRDAQVEIGLDGDVDHSAMIDEGAWETVQDLGEMQSLLWQLSGRTTPLTASREADHYVLRVAGGRFEDQVVGRLSRNFTSDLWHLGEIVCGRRQPPPNRIRGIHLVAVETVARQRTQEASCRFWLAPVLVGLPTIYLDRGR